MNLKLFNKITGIAISNLSIFINFFTITLMMILFSLFNYLNLAAEIALLTSFTFFLCQVFSANTRQLQFKKKYNEDIKIIFKFRFVVFLIILFFSIYLINILNFDHKILLILLAILICTQWLFEIIMTSCEVKKEYNKLFISLLINTLFLISLFLLILSDYVQYLVYLIAIIIFSYPILFLSDLNQISRLKPSKLSLLSFLKQSIINFQLISSFAIHFSNLIWRFSIYLIVGKATAGLLFGSYAVGSFFGTFYINIIGPKIHSSKKIYNNFFLNLLAFIAFLFFILLILLTIAEFTYFKDLTDESQVRKITIMFSLIGSFIMIISNILRFKYFFSSQEENIFKLDIYYSLIIASLVYLIYYTIGSEYLIMAYLFAAVVSFVIYSIPFLKKIYL